MKYFLTFILCMFGLSAGAVQFQAFTNANCVFVDTNGADSGFNIGIRGVPERPFKTIAAAVAVAQAGDTVIINPGAYTTTNSTGSLLKASVNIECIGNPLISGIDSGIGTGFGILDDRTSGATTNTIRGGTWRWTQTTRNNGTSTSATRGLLTVTNANSDVTFKPNRIEIGTYNGTFFAGVYIENCRHVDVKADGIIDIYAGTTIADPDGSGTLESGAMCVFWANGETYVTASQLVGSLAGVWCEEPGDAGDVNLWVNADRIEGRSSGGYGIYVSSFFQVNPLWRTWITAKESVCTNGFAAAIYYGGGRHYLYIDKLTARGAARGFYGYGGAESWAYIQKISSQAEAIRSEQGPGKCATNHITVQHIEDLGGRAEPRIVVNGGELWLLGPQQMVTTNVAVFVTSTATNRAANITSARMEVTGTQVPVFVTTSNLFLDNVRLVGPLTTNSIGAASAQTVGIAYSMGRQTNSSNITLSPNGGFTVDPLVR